MEFRVQVASDGSWQMFWVASALAPASPEPASDPSLEFTVTQR
jgi:hypothetical protein